MDWRQHWRIFYYNFILCVLSCHSLCSVCYIVMCNRRVRHMRVISCSVRYFTSYKTLDFDFTSKGLILLHGATGAGKSTLCDVIPWVLFGTTAKGGTVNEVLSWPGDEVTYGRLVVTSGVSQDVYEIVRIRGSKAKDNDLYFNIMSESVEQDKHRGKDLQDTQRLINNLLGMNADLYLSGAYFHEFSQTAQFFTTTAKNRRLICEQLVDLTLAKTLQTRLSDNKKATSKALEESNRQSETLDVEIRMLTRMEIAEKHRSEIWVKDKQARMDNYITLHDSWEINHAKKVAAAQSIQNTLGKQCPTCGTPIKNDAVSRPAVLTEVNPYLSRISDLEQEVNPYTKAFKDYSKEISDAKVARTNHDVEHNNIAIQFQDIELLQEVVDAYRSSSIVNAIQDIEDQTNALLTRYFDGEIRVDFSVEDADKLEVNITKDGNQASFTQLSKGQRCLLKLCFGASVMKAVQNHHGIKLEQVFFDEALSGLDETLKIKAFSMLEAISVDYESVFVVEHSAQMKECFLNKIEVELINGESVLSGQAQ